MTTIESNDHHLSREEEMLILASKHGLKLNPNKIELNESGLDFLVAFARDQTTEWVLRKPRRPDVWERAVNEHRMLKLVRDELAIDVPNWHIFTPELIAYPLLSGVPLASIDPAGSGYLWQHDQQSLPPIFFDSLAETLASLHNINQDSIRQASIRLKSPHEAREDFALNIEEIKQSFTIPDKLKERWKTWLATDSYWPGHSTLNHGDLHPPHILVDEMSRVTGLLDWTEAECADPGKDFVIYFAIFGMEGLRDLLHRYERYGGKVWPRMHEHIAEQWAAYPALVAKFALTTGKDSDREMANNMIAHWSPD